MTVRKLAGVGVLTLIPSLVIAQVTCTKKSYLVTVSSGSCSSTYTTGVISCADGSTYDIAPKLVSETCGSSFA